MLRFCGFDLELTVETVLQRRNDQTAVFSAVDQLGEHWLIVEAGSDQHAASWICAPASGRAVGLVAEGRAAVTDVLRHSLTGWVELVRVVDGHAVPEQRLSCSELASLEPASPPTLVSLGAPSQY